MHACLLQVPHDERPAKRARHLLAFLQAQAKQAGKKAAHRRGQYVQWDGMARRIAIQMWEATRSSTPQPSFMEVHRRLQQLEIFQNLSRSTLQTWLANRDKEVARWGKRAVLPQTLFLKVQELIMTYVQTNSNKVCALNELQLGRRITSQWRWVTPLLRSFMLGQKLISRCHPFFVTCR